MEREYVESDLIFAGFLVLHCPLKEDAVETLKALADASHRVCSDFLNYLLILTKIIVFLVETVHHDHW